MRLAAVTDVFLWGTFCAERAHQPCAGPQFTRGDEEEQLPRRPQEKCHEESSAHAERCY